MDDADRASDYAERELEARIAACRGVAAAEPARWRVVCADCGEPLPPDRQAKGLCVPCKTLREERDKRWAVGV